MTATLNTLWARLSESPHWSAEVHERYAQRAAKFHDAKRSSPAYRATLAALNSAEVLEVPSVLSAVGTAIDQLTGTSPLTAPFREAWDRAWFFEGGQLLRQWVMADRPGSVESVALWASIVAADLHRALVEAQAWWLEDAAALGADPDDLTQVRPGLGDFHAGHRSVMALKCRTGHQWILRPSSGHLESLVGSVLRHCDLPEVRVTEPVFAAADHCWFRFLSAPSGPTPATEATMRQAGALLGCGWALRAVDFHRGNILVPQGRVTLVDSETFLQPVPAQWNSVNERRWAESVLGVGVLPRKIGSGGAESVEVGMVLNTPPPGGCTPFPRPTITRDSDGNVAPSWDHSAPPVDDGLHLPDSPQQITALASAFLDGADAARDAILQHSDEVLSLLRAAQEEQRRVDSRVIVTPTYKYAQILRLLSHPFVISDTEASVVAAATICHGGDSHLWPEEAFQLLSGDVPAFACPYDSAVLTTLSGRPVDSAGASPHRFAKLTPQQAVIARIRDELPSPRRWEEEKRWIRAAFRARGAALPVGELVAPGVDSAQSRTIFRILDSVGDNPERAFGVDSLSVLVGEDFDRAWEPGACGDELYGGMAGVLHSLLLCGLSETDDLYRRSRDAGLRWARERWKSDNNSRLGLWDGAGGVLLTLTRLNGSHPVPADLVAAIERYAETVVSAAQSAAGEKANQRGVPHPEPEEAVGGAEVISGAAGRCRIWTELAAHPDTRLSSIARRAAEHDLHHLRAALHALDGTTTLAMDRRGYAHGLAGLLDAYVGASRILGRDVDADIPILRRHLNSIAAWLEKPDELPRGWCHGLAGYALTLSECAQNPNLREKALGILEPVSDCLREIDRGIGPSSCHGAAGIVEALDVLSLYYPVDDARAAYRDQVLNPALPETSTAKESGALALMCGLGGVVATYACTRRPCGIVTAPWHVVASHVDVRRGAAGSAAAAGGVDPGTA